VLLSTDVGDDAECHAAKLLEVILLQFKGNIDHVSYLVSVTHTFLLSFWLFSVLVVIMIRVITYGFMMCALSSKMDHLEETYSKYLLDPTDDLIIHTCR